MDKLTVNIKVRVDENTRRIFEAEANSRHLNASDIMREAFREFIWSHNLVGKYRRELKHAHK